ncbi:MAG TPA: CheR family methyltransferase [Myxococcales bacterium]|nr:CheR family methyltransferase [Myxococcales bacterium]
MARPRPKRRNGEAQLEAVIERIRIARNFDFRNYKRATLQRRVERRMHDTNTATLADYIALLDKNPLEYDALISQMLIKVTSFFRDGEPWKTMSDRIIPQILAAKRPGEEIRVWTPGCATGEETFSVAILFAEAMGVSFHNAEIKVFGTDVDEKAINFARHAVYPGSAMQSMPARLREKYFTEEQGGWSVRKEIRRAVVFGVNNLVSDAPISRLDLLVCRNVFIYLDTGLQKRILTRFHYALRRNGIVMLGKSELIPFAARIFEPVDLARRIYRKNGRRDGLGAQDRLVSMLEQESLGGSDESRTELAASEEFYRDLLQSMRDPLIATSLDGTVLAWNAGAAALWSRSEAEVVGKKLPALNLPGLSGDLLIERSNAVRDGHSQTESSGGMITRSDRQIIQIQVEVRALRNAGREISGLIYQVRDVTRLRDLETELNKASSERQNAYEELQTINEEMQSSNEELETTNEELQSANEELQTTNEELQSTNEELETTNEELQSTNAELDATNRELASRTEEMNSLAFFQRTIIRSLGAGVVVLDPTGEIKLWNLAAERLLGLTEDEATGQVLWTLHVPALSRAVLQRLKKALAQKQPVRGEALEYELPNGTRANALLSAVPIVDDGEALGAVVIFEDTTRLSAVTAELNALKGKHARAQG